MDAEQALAELASLRESGRKLSKSSRERIGEIRAALDKLTYHPEVARAQALADELLALPDITSEEPVAESVSEPVAINLIEAVAGTKGRDWDVVLIAAGTSKNQTHYSADTLRTAARLFEGVTAYSDHDRGSGAPAERSIKDKVGRFSGAKFGQWQIDGRAVEGVRARFRVVAPWLRESLMEAVEAGWPDFYGLSINAAGDVVPAVIDGRKVRNVTRLTEVFSVDVVDNPAAGGRIVRLVASTANQANGQEIIVDEDKGGGSAVATETKPAPQPIDVQAAIAEAVNAAVERTIAKMQESAKPAPDLSAIETQIAKLEALQEAQANAARVDTALRASTLSDAGRDQIRESFAGRAFTDEELTTAVEKFVVYESQVAAIHSKPRTIASQAQIGRAPIDNYEAALQGFFKGGEPVEGVKAFTTLEEAYCRYNGINLLDLDVMQMFDDMRTKYDSRIWHKRVRESITTASWGEIFADNLYLSMLRQYQANPMYDRWRSIVSDVESVPDFRTRHYARIGGYADLSTVAEGATYPELTSPADEEVTLTITKHGGIDNVTMEALTDTRAGPRLRQLPQSMARAANRTLFKFVMAMATTDNPTMAYDSVALYDAAHGNTGTTALSITGVNAVEVAMAAQTAYGESLEILGGRNGPKVLIVPRVLRNTAERIINPSDAYTYAFSSTPNADTSIDPQVYKGSGMEVLVFDQLTDATDWWAVADPRQVSTMVVAFLNGRTEPELFVQDQETVGSMFTADKISFKIRHIYGASVIDHRAFYRQVVAG